MWLLLLVSTTFAHAEQKSLADICNDPKNYNARSERLSAIGDVYRKCSEGSSEQTVKDKALAGFQLIDSANKNFRRDFAFICANLKSLEQKPEAESEAKLLLVNDWGPGDCGAYRNAQKVYWKGFFNSGKATALVEETYLRILQEYVTASLDEEKFVPENVTDWKDTGDDSVCPRRLTAAKLSFFGRLPQQRALSTKDFVAVPETNSFFQAELLAVEKYLKDQVEVASKSQENRQKLADRARSCPDPGYVPARHWTCTYSGMPGIGTGETEELARANLESHLEHLCPAQSATQRMELLKSNPRVIFFWLQCKIPGSVRCEPTVTAIGGIRG